MNRTNSTLLNKPKSRQTFSAFNKSNNGWTIILKNLLGSALLLVIIVSGCKKDHGNSNLITKKGNMIINEDKEDLNHRVNVTNQIMEVQSIYSALKSEGIPPKVDLTKNYVFKLVAEVDPPVYEGNTIQATHVKIIDHFAFVTYNTRGDKYLGGLDVFDVTNIKNPKIIWNVFFNDADISAVDYYNNKIYIVGAWNIDADASAHLKTPAMLEVLSLKPDRTIDTTKTIIIKDLSSYVGTDVRVTDKAIYTTSGSNGCLKIFDHSYKLIDSVKLDNARAVDNNGNKFYVLQGQSGCIRTYNISDNSSSGVYNTGYANQAEAKSELAVSEKYIFAALNEGGVQMLNLDGTLKQKVPKPETPGGELDDNYVSNSVSLHGDLVLIANGEAGLYVGGLIETRNDSLAMLGRIKFSDKASSNFVDAKDSVIFVATGLGGLKILTIGIDEGLPPVIIPTKPCPTLYTDIMKLFPEAKNNMRTYDKQFFSNDTISKKLVLTKESEVYVTFVGEGAGWKNTLGYYTYNQAKPPTKVADITPHIIFPNASGKGSGGALEAGDMVQLGTSKFPAGTVISFYLVAMGWQNGKTVPGRYTNYSDPGLNINNHQQHLLFLEQTCSDIVMTFEDIDQDDHLSYQDNDFNDVVFTISDNKDPNKLAVSFDLKKVPKL